MQRYCRKAKTGLQNNPFLAWRKTWDKNNTKEGNVVTYLTDQVLPFWLQCHQCHKWREVRHSGALTPDFVKSFSCSNAQQSGNKVVFYIFLQSYLKDSQLIYMYVFYNFLVSTYTVISNKIKKSIFSEGRWYTMQNSRRPCKY